MLELVPAYAHKEEIGRLFTEYTRMLVEGDSAFQEYLNIQNYDEDSGIWRKNTASRRGGCIWLSGTGRPPAASGCGASTMSAAR